MEKPVVESADVLLSTRDEPAASMRKSENIPAAEGIFTPSKHIDAVVEEEDSSTVASTIFQESQDCYSMTPPLSTINASISQNNNSLTPNHETSLSKLIEISWKPMCKEILRVRNEEDETTVSIFRSLHEAGIPKNVLYAIAHLSLTKEWDLEREKAVECFAAFLLSQTSFRAKLGCMRTLMVLRAPIDASWQLEEACLKEALNFIIHREQEWVLPPHPDCALLWDLRARCLRYQELSREFRVELEDVVKGGEDTAKYIAHGAKWFKKSLKLSLVPVVDYSLDTVGDSLKGFLTPVDADLNFTPRRRSAVKLAADCTAVVRQASTGVRLKAKTMTGGIRSLPIQGFQKAVKKIEDERLVATMVPNDNQREVLTVAGKVGVASLGAAVIVSEAIVDTTAAVVNKTISVTADVVSYKYGDSAGQIIKDTSATTGNILLTIGHLTGLHTNPEGVTKMVAKNASKDQIQSSEDIQDHDNKIEKPLDPLFLLDSDRYEANIVVKKIKNSTQSRGEDAAVVFI